MEITWQQANTAAIHFADYSFACSRQARDCLDPMKMMEWRERSDVAWGRHLTYSALSDDMWRTSRRTIGGSRR